MPHDNDAFYRFDAPLLRPAQPGAESGWGFVLLPPDASAPLPRRGRTTVHGTINGHGFQATLEPDGRLGHWLKVNQALRDAAGVAMGDTVSIAIAPVDQEPEPEVPGDWLGILAASPAAQATWNSTTPIARLDWVHWITSAKQAKTRTKRMTDACDMLASGHRRVCCFDTSGFYSKAFKPPQAAD